MNNLKKLADNLKKKEKSMRKKIICLFFAVFASVLLYGIGYYVGKKLCEDDNYNYKAESVELNPVVSTEQIREVSSTDDIVCKRNMEYVQI